MAKIPHKTMKVAEVITLLSAIKTKYGNVPVFFSSDSEGNNFGTLERELSFTVDPDIKACILYPADEIFCDDFFPEED